MRRPACLTLAACLAMSGIPPAAHAGLVVPSPAMSSFPSVISTCPGGDIAYFVIIRDASGGPLNLATVRLDFSGCPNVHICTPGPSSRGVFVPPASVEVVTGVAGQAIFWVEAGGTCTAGVQLYATPAGGATVQFTNNLNHLPVSVASPDQDGDLTVGTWDAVLMAGKSSTDPTADLNADGVHDSADDAVFVSHRGHVCPSLPTPTGRGSWGGLKLIYR